MIRPHQRIHPYREPVAPRPAATVLLVRDGPAGLEVLMTRRSATASFAPGAYVFPGGMLDDEDASDAVRAACSPRPDQDATELVHAVAAVREAFEECGVLLADDADGRPVDARDASTLSRHAPLLPALAARGWRPAIDRLRWFSHWITDRDLPKRFDVRFFVAPMPEGQEPVADEGETFAPEWIAPAHGLERQARGGFHMIFPTIRTLRALRRFGGVDALMAHCAATGRPRPSCPRGGLVGDGDERFTEDEGPFGELALVAPDGRLLHRLDWRHDAPVRLTRSVMRLTVGNPGMMTGPGTNSYVVGDTDGDGPMAVIDPGPDLPEHIERLAALTAGRLRWILCTHSHPDHSPGAARLARMTGATVAGMPSAPGLRAAWAFSPEHALADGDRLTVGGTDAPCTLRALHTPGHMSNHLCFVLEEDGILFSGDHVLNGSTTVVDPEDGDMAAYLASLARLRVEPVEWILPAHGHVLAPAHAAIDALVAHRLAREAKVLAHLAPDAGRTLDELVGRVYDDAPARLHPVAARSLLAHLLKLEREGRALRHAERWRAAGRD